MVYPSPDKTPVRNLKRKASRVDYGGSTKKTRPGYLGRPTTGFSGRNIPAKYRYKPMKRKTPVRSSNRQINSMSAGFVRLPKRNSKRIDDVAKFQRIGCVQTNEVSGTVTCPTTVDTVYFGHITCPVSQLNFIFCESLLKKLHYDLGVPIRSSQEVLSPLTVGDQIIFNFQTKMNGATALTLNFNFIALDTLSIQAARLVGLLFNNATNYSELDLVGVRFAPQATSNFSFKRWDAGRIRVRFASKSSLKVQNVSAYSATDDEADNVANIPLYGKTYSGNNTGVQFQGRQVIVGSNFTGGISTGVIFNQPDSNDNMYLKEPINAKTLGSKVVGGKIKIDPGHLVTNVLNWKKGYTMANYLTLVYDQINQTDVAPFIKIGKFCFYGLEKMINLGPTAGGNMKFFYEINLQSMATVTIGRNTYTGQDFSSQVVNYPTV